MTSIRTVASLLLCSVVLVFLMPAGPADADPVTEQAVQKALKGLDHVEWTGMPYSQYRAIAISADGRYKFGVGMDFMWNHTLVVDDDDWVGTANGTFSDFVGMNEAELKMSANIDGWNNIYFSADFIDNNSGNSSPPFQGDIKWLVMDMHKLPLVSNVRLGQGATFYTLDNAGAPPEKPFAELSYVSSLTGVFNQHLMAYDFSLKGSTKLIWNYGFEWAADNAVGGNDTSGYDDTDFFVGGGWYPWFRGTSDMLFLGFDLGWFNADGNSFGRAAPGVGDGVGALPLITFNADGWTMYDLHFVLNQGPWYFAGEYLTQDIDNCSGCAASDPKTSTWNLNLSYFLTGESRAWIPPLGFHARTNPKNPWRPADPNAGIGAWEVKLRYQELDATDVAGSGGAPPFSLGAPEREAWGAGLNWYINNNLRLITEYTWEEAKEFNPDRESSFFTTQLQLRI